MKSNLRSVRARVATSIAALLGLSVVAGCQNNRAPEPARDVFIPEPVAQPAYEQGVATTLAIGEEDSGYSTPNDPGLATTLALGEEDGSGPIPIEPGGGIGDGAGPITGEGATTYSIGEEEGAYEKIYIPDAPAGELLTTLAIGEEG